jgi:hypothetical protein
VTTDLNLVPRLRMLGAIPPIRLRGMVLNKHRAKFTVTLYPHMITLWVARCHCFSGIFWVVIGAYTYITYTQNVLISLDVREPVTRN